MNKICIAARSKDAYSETFIKAHAELLPAEIFFIHGKDFPYSFGEDLLLLPKMPLRTRDKMLGKEAAINEFNAIKNRGTLALEEFFRDNKIEAVLAEYGHNAVKLTDLCSRLNIPLIAHFHGYDAYSKNILAGPDGSRYPELFEKAAAIVAVSRDMYNQLKRLGVPENKLHYNPYGPKAIFQEAHISQNPPHFLAVGRFTDKKAPHLTLLAFEILAKEIPDARLTMIGEGPLLDSCKVLAEALGIDSKVEFTGALPHEEIARRMQKARAFVQHSVTAPDGDSEGTPVAILEAAQSALPVVATSHAGIKDVIENGVTGFLVDEKDYETMAEKMLIIIEDPTQAEIMGKASRKKVSEEFSLEKSISGLWDIIKSAL